MARAPRRSSSERLIPTLVASASSRWTSSSSCGQRAHVFIAPWRNTLTRASLDPRIAMLLDLHITTTGRFTVMRVGGEIDLASAPELRECLDQTIDASSRRLVVDLRRVGFMDSVGLGVLVGARRRLLGSDHDDDRSIRLVCTNEQVVRILRVTGLDRVFALYASLADALGGEAGQAEEQSGSAPRDHRSAPEPA
jgi:anti-sigma B factor antagonist